MTASASSSSPAFRRCGTPPSAATRWRRASRRAPAVRRAADWLLAREIRRKGDWSVKRPATEPSGWAFEYRNEFYPDIDDTAMVMLALSEAAGSNPAGAEGMPCARASDWLLAMQSSDGGWAAFDADNNWQFPQPGALRRPQRHARPDLRRYHRARAGSAGGARRGRANMPPCGAAWSGWCSNQEPDGSWYGRWGVAYIYGTCFALRGLAASGRKRPRGARSARRRVAALHPERRWRLGRKLRQLR